MATTFTGGSITQTTQLTQVEASISALESQVTDLYAVKATITALNAEASARQSADSTLQSNIDSEASARQSADATLQSNIDSEASARQAAITQEVSDRNSAISSAISTATSSLTTAINDEASARSAAISAEASARAAADTALQTSITTEVSDREAAVSAVQSDLTQEISDRQAAVSAVQSDLTQEISDRQAAVSAVQSDLTQEISDRQAAVSAVQSDLTQEISDRQAAVSAVQSDLSQEVSDRQAAISGLEGDLNQEANARADADSALDTRLTSVEGRVTTIETNITQIVNLEVQTQIASQTYEQISTNLLDPNSALSTALADKVVATVQTQLDDAQNEAIAAKVDTATYTEKINAMEEFINLMLQTYFISYPPDGVSYSYTGNFQDILANLNKMNAKWGVNFASGADDLQIEITSLKTDSLNNVYMCGQYRSASSCTLNNVSGTGQSPSSVTLLAAPDYNSFLVKYSPAGIVQWATVLPINDPLNWNNYPGEITIDVSNSIYMTGRYGQTESPLYNASGNTQAESSIKLRSTNNNAIYLIKYNTSGSVIWATTVDASNTDLAFSATTDSSSSVYITGYYTGSSATLYNADGIMSSASSVTLPNTVNSSNQDSNIRTPFIAKYDSNGQCQWATYVPVQLASNSNINFGQRIVCDISDNIYISGMITTSSQIYLKDASGTTQTDSQITLPALTYGQFLFKYNKFGVSQWATYLNGGGWIPSLTVDKQSHIYVSGYYGVGTTVDIMNASGTSQVASQFTLPAEENQVNLFLIKYTPTGVADWATYTANTDPAGFTAGTQIAVDPSNNIYLLGYYTGTTTLKIYNANINAAVNSGMPVQSSFTLPATSAQQYNAMVIKYNSAGTAQCCTYFYLGTRYSNGAYGATRSLSLDSVGNLYVGLSYNFTTTTTVQNATKTGQSASQITLPGVTAGQATARVFQGGLIKFNIYN